MNNYRVQKVLKNHKKFKKNIKGGNWANYKRNSVNNNDNKKDNKKKQDENWRQYLNRKIFWFIPSLILVGLQYLGVFGNSFVAFLFGTIFVFVWTSILRISNFEKNIINVHLLINFIACFINLIYSSVNFSNISNSDAELNNDLRNKKGINLAGIITSCIGIVFIVIIIIIFYFWNRNTNSTTTIQN